MSAIIVAAFVVAGGTALSQKGQQDAAEDLQKKLGPSNALEFRLLQARASSASKLEAMADKLENGEPLTNAERTFLDGIVEQTDKSIEETRKETLNKVLGTAAGTGFLRAGRTQDQARRTNIEAETSRGRVRISREQDALNRAFRRTVELPAQIRQSILTGAVSKGQTFIPQVSNNQIIGNSIAAGGSAFITGKAGQDNTNDQTNALSNLLKQIGTGQGGTTSGGTSVQGLSIQEQSDLMRILESQNKMAV